MEYSCATRVHESRRNLSCGFHEIVAPCTSSLSDVDRALPILSLASTTAATLRTKGGIFVLENYMYKTAMAKY